MRSLTPDFEKGDMVSEDGCFRVSAEDGLGVRRFIVSVAYFRRVRVGGLFAMRDRARGETRTFRVNSVIFGRPSVALFVRGRCTLAAF